MHNPADTNGGDLVRSVLQSTNGQPTRKRSCFVRNLLWFGFGFWSLAVFSAIMGTIVTTELDRFENPAGIAVMALFAVPLLAAIFGMLYAGWIKLRAVHHGESARVSFSVSLLAGLISPLLWVAAVGITIRTLGFLGEYVNWLCFAAIVVTTLAVSELAFRISSQWQRKRSNQEQV